MTNDQFQKKVLKNFGNLEKGQANLIGRVGNLEKGQVDLKNEVRDSKAEILEAVNLNTKYLNQGFDRISDQMRETADLRERVSLLEEKVATLSR